MRTQYQVQNETQIRKNQRVFKIDNNELVVKNYRKNKQSIKPPNSPSCKRNNWLEFDKCYFCRNCEYNNNKQKHQIDEKVFRQDHDFSTRLTGANKKINEIWMNIVSTTYNSSEDMINKLQELKVKTK